MKISRVEAYESFDETDFNVMEDELFLCASSDQRSDREQTQQFFLLDETTIILEIYWDDEKVHTVSFENKAELTNRGEMRLVEQKKNEEMKKELSGMSTIEFQLIKGLKCKKRSDVIEEVKSNLEILNDRIRSMIGISGFIKRDVIMKKELHDDAEYKLRALLIILEESIFEASDASETINLLLDSVGQQKKPLAQQCERRVIKNIQS